MTPRHIDWPKALAWAVLVAVSAACWIALGASVASAHAGEPKAPPPHAPATPGQVQAIADRTTAWLAATLRAEVAPRPFFITNDLDDLNDAEFHSGFATPDHVRLRPYLADYLIDRTPDLFIGPEPARGPDRRPFYPPGAAALIHELLHRADTRACWKAPEGEINVEEGIVDALTADLMPAWGWRFWRARTFSPPSYPVDTAAVRAASARATGSRTWRDGTARSWRRALWAASCEGRAAMLAEAV